ncbi:unnamed protein product [Somion occarium]|uniref:G domain-containing protein n=1 Tax=Somion occarium TaxID=3059160 RepID=A0ABP1EAY8_9APHY
MDGQQRSKAHSNRSNANGRTKSKNPQEIILIAVMGATGTGKSTFINLASGANLAVGDGLKSCTSEVLYSHEFILDGRRVLLIDTPGFDDTTVSDTDILKMIALHLQTTYEQGVTLSGILYLHRISDPRMGGVSRRNFTMFRKLCGDETLDNVLLVTTMWGNVDPERGASRERELESDDILFKPVLEMGARMVRHDNTPERAHDILRMIMKNRRQALRIQRELVDEHKDISETGAGAELGRELAELAKKHREELKEIQEDMEAALEAKDMATKRELEEYHKKLQDEMEKAERDRERLSREYAEEKKQSDEQMERFRKDLEAERQARAERQKELERLQQEFANNMKLSAEAQQELKSQIHALQNRRKGFFENLGDAFNSLFSGHF